MISPESSTSRLSLPPELAATIEKLVSAWLHVAISHDIHRPFVERLRLLPLTSDMGGFYGLTPSGDLLEVIWDDESEPKPLLDPLAMNVAMFQGAKRYPDLFGSSSEATRRRSKLHHLRRER